MKRTLTTSQYSRGHHSKRNCGGHNQRPIYWNMPYLYYKNNPQFGVTAAQKPHKLQDEVFNSLNCDNTRQIAKEGRTLSIPSSGDTKQYGKTVQFERSQPRNVENQSAECHSLHYRSWLDSALGRKYLETRR
jgi:hypothetical protein